MNLAQIIDPEWVQAGCPPRALERKTQDPALVARMRRAEAENKAKLDADRVREATAEQRLIDRQAEREAVESRARVGSEAPLRVPAPPPVAVATAPVPKAQPKAAPKLPAKKPPPKAGAYGYSSLRILKVLQKLSLPQAASAICDLVGDDIQRNSVHAFLAGFVGREYATRSGKDGAYKFTLGPRGKAYLDTFGPLD